MTTLSDGRYLVGVWSDSDDRGKRIDVYISENPGVISFAEDPTTGNTVQDFSWFVPNDFPNNASPNFPAVFPEYQSIQVVTECGNQDSFYLIAFRNTLDVQSVHNSIKSVVAEYVENQIGLITGNIYLPQELEPPIDTAVNFVIEEIFEALELDNQIIELGRAGVGDDYVDLYRVTLTPNNINVTLLEEKHMFCEGTLFPIDIDINPSITLFNIPNADPVMISFNLGNLFPADGYCSFAAGGGVYINSSENITLYAVDYYLRDGHQEHQYVRFQEFKPVSPHIVENVEQSWVQPIWKREQTLQFSPGTSSFVIDYDDHEHRNYHNYKSIKRWLETDSDDGSFNDHITGASWLIPDGYQYLFYEHAYQRGQYFPLIGTGQWVSSTLDIDFGVSSSGASTHSHSGPQPISGQEAFLPITSLSKI